MRLREGDCVAFTRQQDGVFIKPKRLVDADDVLTPKEAKKVRKGLKQIRAGKTIPWSRIKHELDLCVLRRRQEGPESDYKAATRRWTSRK